MARFFSSFFFFFQVIWGAIFETVSLFHWFLIGNSDLPFVRLQDRKMKFDVTTDVASETFRWFRL